MEKPLNSLGLANGDLILCPDLAFVNERSGYEVNGDPVFIGPDKFLNGEKLARTHLSFTLDPRNLASFRTVNITAICNRICTVTCKRVARVKNSTVQKVCLDPCKQWKHTQGVLIIHGSKFIYLHLWAEFAFPFRITPLFVLFREVPGSPKILRPDRRFKRPRQSI